MGLFMEYFLLEYDEYLAESKKLPQMSVQNTD
jgi:hypothetical protein